MDWQGDNLDELDPADASLWGGHGRSKSKDDDEPEAPPINDADAKQLRNLLCVHTWASLEVPQEPKLLGDLITPSSRIFLVGRTGLGKTLLAYAMGAGMASGTGFCHWRCDRPSRWLVIDGEMPTSLIKARTMDLIRRAGEIPPGALTIYSQDRAEEFERAIPGLGRLAPINTPEGREFVMRLVNALKPEGVMFDNIMSLVTGNLRETDAWRDTLPLVDELSRAKVAQVYLDHTPQGADRIYGDSTKMWRMDAVGVMTPLPEDQQQKGETAFTLSFQAPDGKARRRTPDNWQDFEAHTIRLFLDQWTSEPAERKKKLSPTGEQFYKALLDALVASPTVGSTTRTAWYAELVRVGLGAHPSR
jgi:hypothetical protein